MIVKITKYPTMPCSFCDQKGTCICYPEIGRIAEIRTCRTCKGRGHLLVPPKGLFGEEERERHAKKVRDAMEVLGMANADLCNFWQVSESDLLDVIEGWAELTHVDEPDAGIAAAA